VTAPLITRRRFAQSAAAVLGGAGAWPAPALPAVPLLRQFGYGDVDLSSALHENQLDEHLNLLMSLSEDSLLKPIRQMIGMRAPGMDLGGWYSYDPENCGLDGAYAPSATFGQWVSALARMYAIKRTPAIRAKVRRLNRLYAQTIAPQYYDNNRFPTYCYDKLVCGLIDSHTWAGDPEAFRTLEHTTDTALPHLPGHAVENGVSWRPTKDESYNNDESYTLSENLFLAYQRGAGSRYKVLGRAYLDDHFFEPLGDDTNNLAGHHAYSYINSLSSASQAYLTLADGKYLRAVKNGFHFLAQQSFATGGWGPNESLQAPGASDLFNSLTHSHNSFETPCGSYAHFKLTRYLLRITGDSQYGDSMERVMYNTILGAKPIQADGRTFYYADFNNEGRKVYSDRRWPCCSGTLPQVAADYRINTYFHGPNSLSVNLFIPSTVRWQEGGAAISLTQKSAYPFEGAIEFHVQASTAREFALNLRIPVWADGAGIAVNGRRVATTITPGQFFRIRRLWKSGDRVQLDLPLRVRLEAIDSDHPDTVALVSGPMVLFPIADGKYGVTRAQLLSAVKSGAQEWRAASRGGSIRLLPFTSIGDEKYSTYFKTT
jgi:DUF1680 family protein